MTVTVDRDTCIGCGLCEVIAPDVFTMDEENIAVAESQPKDAQEEVASIDAVGSCPVNALDMSE